MTGIISLHFCKALVHKNLSVFLMVIRCSVFESSILNIGTTLLRVSVKILDFVEFDNIVLQSYQYLKLCRVLSLAFAAFSCTFPFSFDWCSRGCWLRPQRLKNFVETDLKQKKNYIQDKIYKIYFIFTSFNLILLHST